MWEIFSGKCIIVFQVPTALQLKCAIDFRTGLFASRVDLTKNT